MTRKKDFRVYTEREAQFYAMNHAFQTLDFARAKKEQYRPGRLKMGMWQTLEKLDKLVDESDPDTSQSSQLNHALHTAQALRKAGKPDWLVLAGLIHDSGKMLCYFGEPQWAVVGDTNPLGCRFAKEIVFHEYFKNNPDFYIPKYQTPNGIYFEGIGLRGVTFSWGHDEYLHQVLENETDLPEEALYVIRFHSAYPIHREGAYKQLMDDDDKRLMSLVTEFSKFDLYSKSDDKIDSENLRPFYEGLISRYLPPEIVW